MSDDSPRKDAWDKLRSAATSLSLVAVPILVLIVGSRIDSSLKEAELRQRTVEISVGILQEPPEAGQDSRVIGWRIGDGQWEFCNIILESTNQKSKEASIIFKCPD